MADRYGVKIENRFDLLDEDENGENINVSTVNAKETKPKQMSTQATKAQAKPQPATTAAKDSSAKPNTTKPKPDDIRNRPQTTGANTASDKSALRTDDRTRQNAGGRPFGDATGDRTANGARNQGPNSQESRGPRPQRDGQSGGGGQSARGPRPARPAMDGMDGGSGGREVFGLEKTAPPRAARNLDGDSAPNGDRQTTGGEGEQHFSARDNNGQTDRRGGRSGFGTRSFGRGGGRGYGNNGGGNGGYRKLDEGERREGQGYGGFTGGFDTRGKRVFDRHSGTTQPGVKPVEKKGGAGAHNWGSVTDKATLDTLVSEGQDVMDRTMEDTENPPETGDERQQNNRRGFGRDRGNQENFEEKREEPVEEAPVQLTLEEWKKQEAEQRSKAQFNIRKSGEGEDSSWRENATVVHESSKTKPAEHHDEENRKAQRDQTRKEKDNDTKNQANDLLEGLRFTESSRGGGGGGGRGRGRGRGFGRGDGGERGGYAGRGAPRGSDRPRRVEVPAPRIEDPRDFPALGAAKQ